MARRDYKKNENGLKNKQRLSSKTVIVWIKTTAISKWKPEKRGNSQWVQEVNGGSWKRAIKTERSFGETAIKK